MPLPKRPKRSKNLTQWVDAFQKQTGNKARQTQLQQQQLICTVACLFDVEPLLPNLQPAFPSHPAHLAVYVEVLGPDWAVEFLLSFGGAEMHFSDRTNSANQFLAVVGEQKFKALCAQSHR